jgi:hypothetical protein
VVEPTDVWVRRAEVEGLLVKVSCGQDCAGEACIGGLLQSGERVSASTAMYHTRFVYDP